MLAAPVESVVAPSEVPLSVVPVSVVPVSVVPVSVVPVSVAPVVSAVSPEPDEVAPSLPDVSEPELDVVSGDPVVSGTLVPPTPANEQSPAVCSQSASSSS